MKSTFIRSRIAVFLMCLGLSGSQDLFAQSVTFKTNDYTVGASPFSVLAADIFGTGRPAIITANQADDTATVLGNFGNGTFASNAIYKVSSSPRAIVAADVNRDGKLDLISVGISTTTILTNHNSGMFVSNATVNAGGYSAIAFDLNGNGKSDLIIGGSSTVTVFTNNGSGTLGLSATLPVSGVAAMAAADVNFDGKLDLLVANQNPGENGNVVIFTNSGSGSLISNATYVAGPSLRSLAVADINNDGYTDFIAGSAFGYPTSSLSIWTNNGSGLFGSNTTVAVARSCASIAAADFNGDGWTDLVALDSSDRPGIVSVVTNSSAGFGDYFTIVAGAEPVALAMADFNGDSKPDLVLGNTGTNVTVLLNSTQFLSPPLNIFSPTDGRLVVYWRNPAPDSVLQATTNLANPNWFTVTNGRPIQGVTLSNTSPVLFFRLISK